MGQSHQQRLEMQRVLNGHAAKQPVGNVIAVLCQLDLATHLLMGQAEQVGNVLGCPGAADELTKVAKYIQIYRKKFVDEQNKKLVIAQPDDIPSGTAQ